MYLARYSPDPPCTSSVMLGLCQHNIGMAELFLAALQIDLLREAHVRSAPRGMAARATVEESFSLGLCWQGRMDGLRSTSASDAQ